MRRNTLSKFGLAGSEKPRRGKPDGMGPRLRRLVRTSAVALTAAPIGLFGLGLAATAVQAPAGAQTTCPAPTTTSTTVGLLGGLLPPVTVPTGTPPPCPSPAPAPTVAPAPVAPAPAAAPAPPPGGSSANAASSPPPPAAPAPTPAQVSPAPAPTSDTATNSLAAPLDSAAAPVDLGTPLAPPAAIGGDQTVTTDALPAQALPARPPLVGARSVRPHGLRSIAGPEVLAAILIAGVGVGLFAWTRHHKGWPGHRSARPAAGSGA